MKRYCVRFIIFILTIVGFNVFSQSVSAKPTVRWVVNDLTPLFIKDGPYKGQGISDKLTVFLQDKLPQYNHQIEDMTFSRFYALAQRGDLVCNALLLKTDEREEFLSYSKALKPAYSYVLVASHDHPYPSKAISLKGFLDRHQGQIIVQTNRSYGPLLDPIIDEGRKAGKVVNHNLPTEQLFVMLEKGRFDHFIDMETSASYYRTLHKGKKLFYNVPILEQEDNQSAYSACSKTPAGEKLINEINQIMNTHKTNNAFRDIIESWVPQENLQRFRRAYETEILQ